MMNEPSVAYKYLWLLFWVNVTSIACFLISLIPAVPPSLTDWLTRAIQVAMIFCLWQMRNWNGHYRKAAMLRFGVLGCTLVCLLVPAMGVLNLFGSILGFAALYQEYTAHGEMVEPFDPKLSRKLGNLLFWGIGVGLVVAFGSALLTVLLMAEVVAGTQADVWFTAVLLLPELSFELLYLHYLYRTIQYLA